MGVNPGAISYAIAEERKQWTAANAGPEARAYIGEALDRLAHKLAIQLHPAARPDFLSRCGVAPVACGIDPARFGQADNTIPE